MDGPDGRTDWTDWTDGLDRLDGVCGPHGLDGLDGLDWTDRTEATEWTDRTDWREGTDCKTDFLRERSLDVVPLAMDGFAPSREVNQWQKSDAQHRNIFVRSQRLRK